jgi:hypothetical protein
MSCHLNHAMGPLRLYCARLTIVVPKQGAKRTMHTSFSARTFLLYCAIGAKHREEIYEAFEKIYPTLQEFRKGDAAALLPPAPAPAQQVVFRSITLLT